MARKDKPRINVAADKSSMPLLSDAFSTLDLLDKLLLTAAPEPPPPAVLSRSYEKSKGKGGASGAAPADAGSGGEGEGGGAAAPLKPAVTTVTSKSGQTFKLTEPAEEPNSKGRLVLRRETKHRGGKTVVVVTGFKELPQYNAVMIGGLTRNLQNKLGCGGSFDRNEIVLQGDRPADVALILRHLGFRVDGVTE